MGKLLSFIHNIGLVIVLVSSFIILVLLKYSILSSLLFSIGVVMLTIGRFIGSRSDYCLSQNNQLNTAVRRLYRQRVIAVCLLYLSIFLLFLPEGFYWGYYIRRSLWFIPLLVFTIIEIYTIFRLSSIEKNDRNNSNYK